MVEIQSPTAETRQGKKEEQEEEETTGWKYIWRALLHRVVISNTLNNVHVAATGTSMYSLTLRIRVTTPPQYERNAGASILPLARGVFAGMRSACGVRWAWRITAGIFHAFLVLP